MQQTKHPGPNLKITGQARLLLTVHSMFAVANALSGTFVGIYIWKLKNDFALIGWFAFSNQIAMALTFWIAGKWVKEHNKMNSLRLGIVIAAIFYLLVLYFQKSAVDYVLLLGMVQGISSGFFWLAFNVVYFEVTDPENRDKFNGWAGFLASGAGMTAPWISGLVITQMKDTTGYRLIFSISLSIFVLGVIASFLLKKRKSLGSYEWFHAFARLQKKGNPWRRIVPALMAQGVREGVFGFIIGLLVYIATKNELQLGNFTLITSAVALISFMIAGKVLKPQKRSISMFLGTVTMVVIIVPFFWDVNYFTLLFFGIGTAIFMPLLALPMTSTVFDVIGRNEDSVRFRVEYIVLRELGLNAGRIMGTLLFIAVISWSKAPWVINGLLLFIGSVPILSWFYMRKLHRITSR